MPGALPTVAWPMCLGVEIGSRIRVIFTPHQAGPTMVHDGHVQSITHDWGAAINDWVTTLTLEQAPVGNYWVWGSSDWDSSTRWAY